MGLMSGLRGGWGGLKLSPVPVVHAEARIWAYVWQRKAKYNNSICLSGEFVISGILRTFAGHPVCYFNLPFLLSFV